MSRPCDSSSTAADATSGPAPSREWEARSRRIRPMPGSITVEERGRVLVATLANPPHGLMDRDMVEALGAVVARAETDPEVGGVVLTGAHPERFVAHYDVGELLAGAEGSPAVGPAAL